MGGGRDGLRFLFNLLKEVLEAILGHCVLRSSWRKAMERNVIALNSELRR